LATKFFEESASENADRIRPVGLGLPARLVGLHSTILAFWHQRHAVDWSGTIKGWVSTEEARLGLFIPVFLAIGIAHYFSRHQEPGDELVFWSLLSACLFRLAVWRQRRAVMLLGNALICMALGFAVSSVRTQMVQTPIIERETGIIDLSGILIDSEARQPGWRLVIAPDKISGLGPEDYPRRIRINWRGAAQPGNIGDRITLRAGLSPPPPPVVPGGYDFGRNLFFQGIGAVGFAVTPPSVIEPYTARTEAGPAAALARRISVLRNQIFTRIADKAEAPNGAILAAIVTGKRELIPVEAEQALRDSGLAHLLAISGLHMGLATGLLFFGVRFVLAQLPQLALRLPVKKIAAGAALCGGFFYLLLSGSGWSSRRAFIMTAIMLVAILADRRALSLRNVAIAATLILLLSPEALLHAGFQMSFGAVTALIAAYESWSRLKERRANARDVSPGAVAGAGQYIAGIAVTDTIAATATAPFALFHFHRSAVWSLPANITAMPIMGLWVMPAVVLAMLFMPLGLDGPWWQIAAAGVGVILAIGDTVSDWPGAVVMLPQQPVSWLATLTLGGLLVLTLRTPLRWLGLLALPLAFTIAAAHRPPDLFIARSGENVGLYVNQPGAHHHLAVLNARRDRFSINIWGETVGIDMQRQSAIAFRQHYACDALGCVINHPKGHVIAISERQSSLVEDCARATLVVATYPADRSARPGCAATLIDRRDLWNGGAIAVKLGNAGQVRWRGVDKARAGRPWGGG